MDVWKISPINDTAAQSSSRSSLNIVRKVKGRLSSLKIKRTFSPHIYQRTDSHSSITARKPTQEEGIDNLLIVNRKWSHHTDRNPFPVDNIIFSFFKECHFKECSVEILFGVDYLSYQFCQRSQTILRSRAVTTSRRVIIRMELPKRELYIQV